MKKIMFSYKFGLTEAVLTGRKTVTRRIVPLRIEIDALTYCTARGLGEEEIKEYIMKYAPYKVGEEVAVAMSYKDLNRLGFVAPEWLDHTCEDSAGYRNKMFVRADLMPLRIRITDIRVERLQDITYKDCLKEGVLQYDNGKYTMLYVIPDKKATNGVFFYYSTPREAFAYFIDKINGRGTWKRNPFVYRYEFKAYLV